MDENIEYLLFSGDLSTLPSGTRVMITQGEPLHEGLRHYRVSEDVTEREVEEHLSEEVLTTLVVE